MNVAMTYNMLPDFSAGRGEARPVYHFPMAGQARAEALGNTDLEKESRSVYKYYVINNTDDRIYTRTRTTETLYHQARGSIVDVYA